MLTLFYLLQTSLSTESADPYWSECYICLGPPHGYFEICKHMICKSCYHELKKHSKTLSHCWCGADLSDFCSLSEDMILKLQNEYNQKEILQEVRRLQDSFPILADEDERITICIGRFFKIFPKTTLTFETLKRIALKRYDDSLPLMSQAFMRDVSILSMKLSIQQLRKSSNTIDKLAEKRQKDREKIKELVRDLIAANEKKYHRVIQKAPENKRKRLQECVKDILILVEKRCVESALTLKPKTTQQELTETWFREISDGQKRIDRKMRKFGVNLPPVNEEQWTEIEQHLFEMLMKGTFHKWTDYLNTFEQEELDQMETEEYLRRLRIIKE